MRQKSLANRHPVGRNMTNEQDKLFAENRALTAGFRFDEQVVKVFPDMISRSVPGYELVVPMIGMLARRYARDDTILYDLGCSLGAVSLAMGLAVRAGGAKIVAVDNSKAMVERCRKVVAENRGAIPIDVRLQNIRETPIENASVVVLNFTLQFLELDERQALIDRIAAGMLDDGVLIVSEKICFEDRGEQADQTAWHHDFKRTQGYSELEIAGKRNALEDVLRPETEASHLRRFQNAGFSRSLRWFQCFSFASYIAFK
jgi:tRNA (cmo5U34)-methyltransferase